MTKDFSRLLLTGILLSGSLVRANDSCFSSIQSNVIKSYGRIKADSQSKARALENTCEELANPRMYQGQSLVQAISDKALLFFGAGVVKGLGTSAFSKLQNSELQRKFKSDIERIKKIPDRMERIQEVYQLVSRNQGQYDYETLGARTSQEGNVVGTLRPENLINSSEKYGTAGVCTHFAGLLYWSLLQVGRHSDSTSVALGENDFSVTYMTGEVPLKSNRMVPHVWVRVNIPFQRQQGGLEFQDFDLDTTYFPDQFSLLVPRLEEQSMVEIQKLQDECRKARLCLMKRAP